MQAGIGCATGWDRCRDLLRRAVHRAADGILLSGTRASGDLPPRPECATTAPKLLATGRYALTLAVGRYALVLENPPGPLTETVLAWPEYQPGLATPASEPAHKTG
jgi:hypothetical protein